MSTVSIPTTFFLSVVHEHVYNDSGEGYCDYELYFVGSAGMDVIYDPH